VCADNQNAVVREVVRCGAATHAPSLDAQAIGSVVAVLCADGDWRGRLHLASLALVDGRGAERVALAFGAETIAVREATITDARISHRWRDDPRTRATAHVKASIEWGAHLDWWTRSATRSLLMGCCGAREIGVIRFDRVGPSAAVSIYLDPDLTGLGLGVELLESGRQWLLRSHADVKELRASIRRDNAASQAAFRAAGYLQVGESDWSFLLGDATPSPIRPPSTNHHRP
jgi:UDP-2,4-diacetamido-2,4,6-trideoxy-beta-L-altropyranose hydrolase